MNPFCIFKEKKANKKKLHIEPAELSCERNCKTLKMLIFVIMSVINVNISLLLFFD